MVQQRLSEQALQMRRQLLTETEAAAYLGGDSDPLNPGTLAKWRVTGGGPKFIRISSNPKSIRADVRYDVADLDTWLDERKFASTSEAACSPGSGA